MNSITSSTRYKDFMKLALIIPSQENPPISPNKWHITKSKEIKSRLRPKWKDYGAQPLSLYIKQSHPRFDGFVCT
jgi:hypothetical protein